MSYYEREEYKSIKEPMFGIRQLGTTSALMGNDVDPVQNIKGQIFSGAGSIELFAPGQGQAQAGQAPSFESIQEDQRQAIRELTRVNKVDVTVHGPIQGIVLSGLGRNGFEAEQREKNFIELRKAIDFSAEAANGGSVVIHTGDFPRALSSRLPNDWKDDRSKWDFRAYKEEKDEAQYLLVDRKTGKIAQGMSEKDYIFVPEYETDEKGKIQYVQDEHNKPVCDPLIQSAIIDDPDYKKFGKNGKKPEWDDLPEYVKSFAYLKKLKYDPRTNEVKMNQEYLKDFAERRSREIERGGGKVDQNEILKDFFREKSTAQAQSSLAQYRMYEEDFAKITKQREDVIKKLKFYEKLQKEMSKEDWETYKKSAAAALIPEIQQASRRMAFDEDDVKDPITLLQKVLQQNTSDLHRGSEMAVGMKAQVRQSLEQVNQLERIDKFAFEKSIDAAAEIAMYAYHKTLEAKQKRPTQDNFKDIQITLENIFPQMGGQDYGSHPDELIKIIDESRKKFKEMLIKQEGKSKEDADKLAKAHIAATLDTGHLNVWKKHMVRKDGEDDAAFNNRFKEWYTTQVNKMVKDGYVGNVHLADNFGYDDVHLTPGQGNAPIREVLDILKKHEYAKKITAEGGWGPGQTKGLKGVWRETGASVYSKGTEGWVNPSSRFYSVDEGYHGRANKPFFIFRGYAPDSDDWKPWSGIGLE